MKVWKRASLYLMRKKGKSVILLAILTVIATLALLCMSIGNAADSAMKILRETMGGYFKIGTDYSQGYAGQVDEAMVQKVMDAGGMKAYNGMDITYLMTEDLELQPGRFTGEGDRKAKLARFLGNTDTSLNEYFVLRYYTLKEGRHIGPEDEGKAVISRALAERNQLSLGDTFTVRINDEDLTEELKERMTSHTLEVVGIYEIEEYQVKSSSDAAECDIEENFIFTDTEAIRKIYEQLRDGEITTYTDGATFFVQDPKELEERVEALSQIEGYQWEEYAITKNNKTYEDSAIPLQRLSGMVTMMVAVIVVISLVMLSLVLFLWMRERLHEIGIYLSIGIQKSGIIGQHILENLMVAILAFLLAWAAAGLTSGTVERAVGTAFSQETESDGANENEAEETKEDSLVEVRIGLIELCEIWGMGILIVIFSTGISSIIVLKMKPKDILSSMS